MLDYQLLVMLQHRQRRREGGRETRREGVRDGGVRGEKSREGRRKGWNYSGEGIRESGGGSKEWRHMAVGRRNHRHTIHNAYTCMCVCVCTWDILVYSCIAISELMISIINTPNIRQTDRQYIFFEYIYFSLHSGELVLLKVFLSFLYWLRILHPKICTVCFQAIILLWNTPQQA